MSRGPSWSRPIGATAALSSPKRPRMDIPLWWLSTPARRSAWAIRRCAVRSRRTGCCRVPKRSCSNSVTGDKLTGHYMMVRELQMGPVGLKDLAIVFADAHIFKQLKLEDRPALLLGMNAMRAFKKVSIDFAAKTLRLVVPEHSALDVQTAQVPRTSLPPKATTRRISTDGLVATLHWPVDALQLSVRTAVDSPSVP